MYPKPLQDYIDQGEFDESWSSAARNRFLFNMMNNRVKDKKFAETGSKSGVITYGAHWLGAELAVGVEQEADLVLKANQTMAAMGAPQTTCHSFHYNALWFDYSWFDITFCIGMLYNIDAKDKKRLLWAVSQCPWVLVECWVLNDNKDYPTVTRIEEEDKPFQWFPNRAGIQHLLSEHFDTFREVTPKSFLGEERENAYFVCESRS